MIMIPARGKVGLVLGAVALALSSSAATPAFAQSAREQIEALPFIKAYNYARAIQEYCFIEPNGDSVKLVTGAMEQEKALGDDLLMFKGYQKAVAHLAGDQSACEPASSFVQRTIADLPALTEKFDTLLATRATVDKEWQESEQARKKAEAEAKKKQEETMRVERMKWWHCPTIQSSAFNAPLKGARSERNQVGFLLKETEKCRPFLDAKDIEAMKRRLTERRDAATAAIEKENAEIAKAEPERWAKENPPIICRFKGIAKMVIKRTSALDYTLTIGKDAPIRLYVGSGYSSATTTDGKEVIFGREGVDFDGKHYSGTCDQPQ